MTTYTTVSGDEWDGICYKHYGTEMVMDEVMHANLEYINIAVFPAGVVLKMPKIKDVIQTTQNKPPWMR